MPLADLMYPPRCPPCGAGLAKQGGVRPTCWEKLSIPGKPACETCRRPFIQGQGEDGARCAPCLAEPPRHAGIAAGVLYNDAARSLAIAFKHGGKIGLASFLAILVASKLDEEAGASSPLLVPVPLHRWRLWKRGYNQAALLARELAKLGKRELSVDLLLRKKRTQSWGGLGKKARRRALRGAIEVNPKRKAILYDRHVIVVDDVLASGATSDACVQALLKQGAKSVNIACFARVLDDA